LNYFRATKILIGQKNPTISYVGVYTFNNVNIVSCLVNSRGRTVIMGATPPPTWEIKTGLRECTGVFSINPPPM
jgi:hypothetical protein